MLVQKVDLLVGQHLMQVSCSRPGHQAELLVAPVCAFCFCANQHSGSICVLLAAQGKVVNLDKPFVVMRKHKPLDAAPDRTQYHVKAVIRQKIIFTTRPKPLVRPIKL